ncbi:MAG: hypothetical protein RML15_07325 [Bacteroidota bacterium]|nr:hypothetical protein [Candidatus Kapabacteria bacterium]MCX7936690.1 hypothetical protein [Chlorobiota bacterium]MDW8272203.1 hypothetical protein [Bacteroidota bacterium]
MRWCYWWLILLGAWGVVQWSCQTAVEPTAEIVSTPVVVFVHDQRGQPVDGARVQWVITRRGATAEQIDAAFARASGAQEGYTGSGGTPGVVSFDIPVPVADEQALILLRTTPPLDPAYRGRQKNGDFRLDTIVPCGPTRVDVQLIRQYAVVCGQPAPCSDVRVQCAPGQTVVVAQGDFVQNDAEVRVEQVRVGALPPGVQVVARVRVGNQAPQQPPVTVPQGQPYRIEFNVSVDRSAPATNATVQVTIVVVQRDGTPCWQCTFDMSLEVRPLAICDCPQRAIRVDAQLSACLGTVRDTTVRIGLVNPNQQCSYRIQVQPNRTEDPAELSIVALNTVPGQSVVVPPGGRLDSVRIRFAPQRARVYRETFVLQIFRETARGLQPCDSAVLINVTAISAAATFAIDTARSTLFRQQQNGYVSDTLENCATRNDPRSSRGTLCIRNTSPCTVELGAELQGAGGVFSLEGRNSATIQLPPGEDTCLTVAFVPTAAAVYPRGRCNPAQRNFQATLTLRQGSQLVQVPVYGYAELDVACASKATAALYEFGAQDANGTRYYITINIVQSQQDNTLLINEQLDGQTDSVEIYVLRITTVGPPPNDANITTAVLATGRASQVEFNIVARNIAALPQDICQLFNQYGCSFDPTQWTLQPTVREGDILLFRFGSSYGILWVKKLSWSNRSPQALPQVEVLTCYPFN